MRSRWAVIWAIVLILGGVFLLAQNFGLLGELSVPVWSVLFAGLGILFLLNFVTDMAQWWSLIPGCILLGLGAVTLGAELDVQGELLGSLMLFSIGLPFLLIYLVQTARGQKDFWWALIPGGILIFMGLVVLAAARVPGEVIGTVMMWGIALPFVWVYLTDRPKNWWALIPGGVMLVIGAMPLLTLATDSPNILGGVFFLGLGAVFGVIYVLNPTGNDRAWAIYPAAVLVAIGVGIAILGQNWWPVVLIAIGVLMLVRTLRPRTD